ncbi:TIGR00725 family protein [Streptomyces phaeofaciens]|uniref:TIGR00725 family protein n=1 Tax=Streptomyces phaeofaciens TaxID=68254 RepID=UPI0036BFE0BA
MADISRRHRPYIGVAGPGEATALEKDLARQVGTLLAQRSAVVVCGGLTGVMEACAEGASAAGGTVVGLLPGLNRSVGNRHLTITLTTGLGELRNGVLVNTCDALIAVGGSWGTLSEVALAVRLGKPVAALRSWALPLQSASSAQADLLIEVSTPAEAVQTVLQRRLGTQTPALVRAAG